MRLPVITARDENGTVCDIFQAGASDRPSWLIAWNAARNWYPRESGFTLDITVTE